MKLNIFKKLLVLVQLLPLFFKKKDGKVLHDHSVEPLAEDPRKDEKHTNHKGQSVKVEDGMKVQPLMPPIKPAGKMIPSRHEVWITTYHEAETSNPFYKKFGLDMPCGLRCKEGSLVLPLYGGNLKVKCEVVVSDEGKPLEVEILEGEHFWIGNDEPSFVVPDIVSACIIFQETGRSAATYLAKNNIHAMAKLFPSAVFITAGEGLEIAQKSKVKVLDLTEEGQIISLPKRYQSGDDIFSFLGVDPGIVFRPLWASLKVYKAVGWLLKNYIPVGPSLSVIFSPSGIGKTFLVLDIFLTMAAGIGDWHGIECKKARCLYMCAEGYAAVIPRVQCWIENHGISDLTSIDLWIENGSVTLDDPASVALLQKSLDRRFGSRKPDIIAIDTLNLFMQGDENATQSATAFVQALKSLSAENNCTILLVHHTGNANEYRARGSSVIKGSLDTEMRLSYNNDGGYIVFDQTKNRFGRVEDKGLAFFLEEKETLFKDENGENVTSCILQKKADSGNAKHDQDEVDLNLLKEAFKMAYKQCPNPLEINKEQLKGFAFQHWRAKGSAEISRQINPKQDTRWVGRMIKAGIVETDRAGTTFKVVKESAVKAIQDAFDKGEAPS